MAKGFKFSCRDLTFFYKFSPNFAVKQDLGDKWYWPDGGSNKMNIHLMLIYLFLVVSVIIAVTLWMTNFLTYNGASDQQYCKTLGGTFHNPIFSLDRVGPNGNNCW